MDELPPKAAALLRAARCEQDPSRADSERVRRALAVALAAPALGDAGGQALTLGKTASRWLSAGWIKGVAVVGLVAGATLVATWQPAQPSPRAPVRAREAAAARANVPQPVVRAAAPQPVVRAAALPENAPAAEPVVQVPAQPPTSVPFVPRANLPPKRSTPGTPRARAQAAPANLAAHDGAGLGTTAISTVTLPAAQPAPEEQAPGELALMRRALERLNAGDAEGALAQLSLHATRFPNGVMTEERDGLRAVAWCKGGDRARGVAAAHSFLRLYPDSPLAARVRGACKVGAP